MKLRTFLALGVVLALLLAGVVSWYASASPDGLEKVAEDKGFSSSAEDHRLADSPFADYGTQGVTNERLSGGLAGVVGVGATLLLGGGLFLLIRRRGTTPAAAGSGAGAGPGAGTGPNAGAATAAGSASHAGSGPGTGVPGGGVPPAGG